MVRLKSLREPDPYAAKKRVEVPRPANRPKPERRAGRVSGELFGCPRLYGRHQGLVRQVGIPLGRLITRVTQHLADREQVDAAIHHETSRAMP